MQPANSAYGFSLYAKLDSRRLRLIVEPLDFTSATEMTRLLHVRQLDSTGCGIACIAAFRRTSYRKTKQDVSRILKWSERRTRFYLRVGQVAELLKHFRLRFKKVTFSDWSALDGISIVGVRTRPKGGGYHHWVICISGPTGLRIMDPRYKTTKPGHKLIEQRAGVFARPGSTMFQLAGRDQ